MTKYYNEKCQAWCMLDDATKDAIRASGNLEFLCATGQWTGCSPMWKSNSIYRAPKLTEAEKFLEKWKGKKICHPSMSEGEHYEGFTLNSAGQIEAKHNTYAGVCVIGIRGEWQLWTPPEPKQIPLTAKDIKQGDAFRKRAWATCLWVYATPMECSAMINGVPVGYSELLEEYEIRSIGETEWRPCSKESK